MKKETVKWFKPGVESGWHKGDPERTRRNRVLHAHKGNYLKSALALQALANVTQDQETRKVAIADAEYFRRKYHEGCK